MGEHDRGQTLNVPGPKRAATIPARGDRYRREGYIGFATSNGGGKRPSCLVHRRRRIFVSNSSRVPADHGRFIAGSSLRDRFIVDRTPPCPNHRGQSLAATDSSHLSSTNIKPLSD
jgi:hypothetical protein